MSNYDSVFFGQSIHTWIDMIHTNLCDQYEMPKRRMVPNTYRYDAHARILEEILMNISPTDIQRSIYAQIDLDMFAERAHCAWVDHYLHWKNTRSKRSITSASRNDRATTQFQNLDSGDQHLYYDVINIIFKILQAKMLELGMQALSI